MKLAAAAALIVVVTSAAGAASAASPIQPESIISPAAKTGPTLKRRIAIGRFSNATNYGRALLLPGERDPLADQAADMLAARLVASGEFIVLERRDLETIKGEQALIGGGTSVGADTVLVGSVTQFGRQAEGRTGFLSAKARQVASATVEVRLVDSRTGQAFFSTSGTGNASVEASNTMGFGSQNAYDSTLNDKAISAAISDLMTNVINKLKQQPWSTDILSIAGAELMVSGGSGQGLNVGDRLQVARRGTVVVSRQTGLPIELPSEPLATIQITGFFGSGDGEGSRAQVITGQVPALAPDLIVTSTTQ